MLCRSCEEAEAPRRREDQEQVEAEPDQLCSRCGQLLGPKALVKRAKDKNTQLERFGLAGRKRRLLERRRKKGS